MDLQARYRELLERVDAHAAAVQERHAERIACRPGCAGCCTDGRGVFPIEAEAIVAWIEEHGLGTEADRQEAGEAAAARVLTVLDDERDRCAFLDGAHRCRIYPVRPLVCRTHGLPLAVDDGDGGRRGDVCPLSFDGGAALAELPGSDFLDLPRLDTILAALELARARAAEEEPGRRVPLRRLHAIFAR